MVFLDHGIFLVSTYPKYFFFIFDGVDNIPSLAIRLNSSRSESAEGRLSVASIYGIYIV